MMKNSHTMLRDHGIIFFTTLLIFLFIPLYMITLTPDEYYSINKLSLAKVGSVLALIYISCFLSLYWILRLCKFYKTASCITLFTFFWVIFAGYLFPMVQNSGMLEPLLIPNNIKHFILVIALSLTLTVLMKTKLHKAVLVFASVFLSLSIIPSLYQGYLLFNSSMRNKIDKFTTLSRTNNILVLSLDGIPGRIAYDLIAQNPELQKAFKDFIQFDNVISTSPATAASLSGELYGNMDLKTLGATQGDLYKNPINNELILNKINSDAFTYHSYNAFNTNKDTRIEIGELANISVFDSVQTDQSLNFFEFVAVRLGSSKLLTAIIKANQLALGANYSFIHQLFPNNTETNQFLINYQNHQGPSWDKINIPGIFDFNNMVKGLKVGSSPLTVRYMHFTFPHFPVDFDEQCNYRSYEKAWYDANQNEKGIINESKCSLKKMAWYLSQLKSIGAYDNSLIILKSDHGQPAYYYTEAPQNYKINGHPLWGYDRYRPMLLIKNYNQHNPQTIHKQELVTLNDLAQTLCKNTKIQTNCRLFPGIDLLSDELTAMRDLFIYVPKNKESSFAFDTHKSVMIKNNNNEFIEILRNTKDVILG